MARIDSKKWTPIPENVFVYKDDTGAEKDYPSKGYLQLRVPEQRLIHDLADQYDARPTLPEKIDFLASVVESFVPTIPATLIREEPIEVLMGFIRGLAAAGSDDDATGEGAEARPTKGPRKSKKARSTRRSTASSRA